MNAVTGDRRHVMDRIGGVTILPVQWGYIILITTLQD